MKTYLIYHIPGIKIGCTNDLHKRMRDQGFTEWEILEEHNDIIEVSNRELQLQKDYGYKVDKVPYWVSVKNRPTWADTDQSANGRHGKGVKKPGVALHNQTKRKFTKEEVNEIKSKYIPRVYTQYMLAEEYGCVQSVISKVLNTKYKHKKTLTN